MVRNFLNALTNNRWASVQGVAFSAALRSLGIPVGVGLSCRQFPRLQRDPSSQILIGNNVEFKGEVDLRVREGSSLVISDDVRLDSGVRIVVANGARVILEPGVDIGILTIMNCGADVNVGRDTLIAGMCLVQTGQHGMRKSARIRGQAHIQDPIVIGADCWVGSQSTIVGGVSLGLGAVVGANSVVNSDIPQYAIAVGSPARVKSYRHD